MFWTESRHIVNIKYCSSRAWSPPWFALEGLEKGGLTRSKGKCASAFSPAADTIKVMLIAQFPLLTLYSTLYLNKKLTIPVYPGITHWACVAHRTFDLTTNLKQGVVLYSMFNKQISNTQNQILRKINNKITPANRISSWSYQSNIFPSFSANSLKNCNHNSHWL